MDKILFLTIGYGDSVKEIAERKMLRSKPEQFKLGDALIIKHCGWVKEWKEKNSVRIQVAHIE